MSPPAERMTAMRDVSTAARTSAEQSDHRHRPLLCPCRERPRRRCAAEQGYQLAPSYVGHGLLQAAMHQVGADTVISLGAGHSITLQHVSAGSLHASDFLLV